MAKFNLSGSIGSILNEASQTGAKKLADNIFLIPVENIKKNEINKYSISDIEKLKFTIKHNGLKQPLEVKKTGDAEYTLISGERRLTAIHLILDEKDEGYEDFLEIPCLVTDIEKNKLPLSSELKELYANLTTNEVRDKTDYDLMIEVEGYSKIFAELKKDKKLATELEKAGLIVSGQKREFVAQNVGVSKSSVQRLENISENLIDDFKDKFKEDKLPVTVASSIANLSMKDQQKLSEIDNVTQKDVDNVVRKKVKKEKTVDTLTYDTYIVNQSNLKKLDEIRFKTEILLKDAITLTKGEYAKFEDAQEQITKAYEKIIDVVTKVKSKYDKDN